MPKAQPAAPSAAHRPSGAWQVRLLGGLQLDGRQQQIQRLPSRAVTALLARLALWPDRTHAREQLVDLLWPGVEPAVGRNRLRQALSSLKSLLEGPGASPDGPVLLADRLGVRVAPGALHCDAVEFEVHWRAGRHAAAAACYRGELLPGFYDEWIEEERQRLAALFERVPPPAVPAAPAPAAPVPAAPAELVTLPSYLTRLFGAGAQAARLRERVLDQRLVTLLGPGGAGKTRLAVEAAQSLRQDFARPAQKPAAFVPFDIIAFVPLASCSSRAQVLDAIAGTLQFAQGADDPLQALFAALRDRRVLLVLDNFEQLVDCAATLVESLLAGLPALHLVLTSRRTLGLAGEIEFVVDPLPLPAADADLAETAANPAVALFVERARAVRADFHLGTRNAAAMAALVSALEGMPLAIELAASRVRSISPADMLQRLRRSGTPRLDLLARQGAASVARSAAEQRHASMQRAIAWSWDLLDAAPSRLLSLLTVFAGSFSAEAACVLVDDEGLDAPLLLDELVSNSLVHRLGDGDELRFGIYQPIREFARARLDETAARHGRSRLRHWARHWALALPSTPPLRAVRTEMPNLLAALASAVADDAPEHAIELLLALRRCLEDVELPAEGLVQAQAAVEHCADPGLKALGHSLLGPMLYTAGQGDAAMQHAALGLQGAGAEPGPRARALHALARVRWRSRRRADEVEPLLDEADALMAEGTADRDLQASLLALRAFVANVHHRDYAGAERLHSQALALWEAQGNQHAVNSGRYNLAVCAQNANRQAVCLQRLAPVIASAHEQQDWRRLSQSLNVSGNAHSGLRDWPRAVADYRACIGTAWRGMATYDLAFGLWNLPRALAHRREPEAAVKLCAFAAAFWRSRFGELTAADQLYLLRVRRLARCQIDATRLAACWQAGEALTLSQAVALAMPPLLPT